MTAISVSIPGVTAPEVPKSGFGADEAAMALYRKEGTERAISLGNYGPAEFDDDGKLKRHILDQYWQHGFYVFTDVVGEEERADIAAGVADVVDRLPLEPGGKLDKHGRPALGADCEGRNVRMYKPLSDPVGGSNENHGRHPVKMLEPDVPEGAPDYVMQVLAGCLQHSEALLRYYGHPVLLAIAASINGDDFTPFNEGLWIKHPRLGASVAWHQDGWTHWEADDFDAGTHGYNSMMQLTGCDAANGLWVVPGTHATGKCDIASLMDAEGTDRLPSAVPLVCNPGDLAIVNRQAVHGSFANTSDNPRISVHAGFHRRKSVLNVESGGIHNPVSFYDEAYIKSRSRMVMYGIDARRQRFPDETPFVYQPLADEADNYRWDEAAKADVHDYNLQDLGI